MICRQEGDLIADLVTSFEPFVELQPAQRVVLLAAHFQWFLFKNFWPCFKLLEQTYDSVINWKFPVESTVMADGTELSLFHASSQLFSIPALDDDGLDESVCLFL